MMFLHSISGVHVGISVEIFCVCCLMFVQWYDHVTHGGRDGLRGLVLAVRCVLCLVRCGMFSVLYV